MTEDQQTTLADLWQTVYYLRRDPSPHAPEIPWELNNALDALFAAFAVELARVLL